MILTSFDVDVLGQVPNLFISDERVIIGGMHDTGVVELFGMIPKSMMLRTLVRRPSTHDDIQSSKLLHSLLDARFDLCFLAHITLDRNRLGIGVPLVDALNGLLRGFEVDVCEDGGTAFGCEEKRCLESDTAVVYGREGSVANIGMYTDQYARTSASDDGTLEEAGISASIRCVRPRLIVKAENRATHLVSKSWSRHDEKKRV